MARSSVLLLTLLIPLGLFAQQGQLDIARISLMPASPAPLLIRDWKKVARDYDRFVFDLGKTGQYLPLSKLSDKGRFNYPENTALYLDSYVGAHSHLNQAEAVNLLPAIVGASLAGIDKSDQDGINWVAKTIDFFNLKNRQNVYLNGYFAASGSDWWYDLMPNLFFYQLRALYPGKVPEFESQFVAVADRWLGCVAALGGGATPWKLPNMNFRAFNLITGIPLNESVPEPESAGSIAWLLYNAYLETGEKKYLTGSRLAMDFLAGLKTNPSYELQLPYGTLAAARMNAVEGTAYPLQKMLGWCFNRGDLRGWGSIVGKWGGYDVSGLIGEANDGGDDYAFVMNGFQQAGALAPLPKYDKRYARSIAKWILNLANASRLFYTDALPEANQDSYAWSAANDPDACIPHESMKEIYGGRSPYATGDAIRGGWASTNLSLYSGSSAGYLGAVVQATEVPGILQIDLNRTDFYGDNALPAWLYYNPETVNHQVVVKLPPGTRAVYEAITESVLFTAATDSVIVEIPAGEVKLIRLYNSTLIPEARNGKLYAGGDILDHHYRYDYTAVLRIKSLAVLRDTIGKSSALTAWCEPENIPSGEPVTFEWLLDGVQVEGQGMAAALLMAPGMPGLAVLKCRIRAGGQVAEDSLRLVVVDRIAVPPVVTGIQSSAKYTATSGSTLFTALVEPVAGDTPVYVWTASSGTLGQPAGNTVFWQAPAVPGVAKISVTVTNRDKLSASATAEALVKDTTLPFREPIIWYPFDAGDRNEAADRFHATSSGVMRTDDARGLPSLAYRFTTGQNIIYTENGPELNFTGAVSLSCWVKAEELGSERFILSHGSWQQRYKLSLTPEGRLRWTVKTDAGICDLDGPVIELNRYYHATVIYTGYSMELYVNGTLEALKSFSGAILPSTRPFTIGRMDEVETLYAFRGAIDEVRVWDGEIPPGQIRGLKDLWYAPPADSTGDPVVRFWPNPASDIVHLEFRNPASSMKLAIFTSDGREAGGYTILRSPAGISITIPASLTGLCLLRINFADGRVAVRKVVIRR